MIVLAIDIGGTKLAAGVVEPSGRILARAEVPTRAFEGLEPVLERIIGLGRALLARAELLGSQVVRVGVGCAGPVNRRRGLVLNPPNLPGWDRVPLAERLQAGLGLPIVLENDANAAALGEFRYGAGRGAGSLVYYTVSTGIGGGIVLDGRLWHGLADAAGEVGHMTVKPDGPVCGCGNRGCLEAMASGPSMVRLAKQALDAGRPSRLRAQSGFTAKELVQAAREGDALAREVWDEAVRCLGIGVAAVITILAPERIVVGGGVSRAGEFLLAPLREEVRRHVKLVPVQSVPILPAALGPDVGILGAAAVALDEG
ncbi:MAG: ROK family protein [candidate division NC10 bacterium]|nr:ROK family protein [candidate division NC10 bacterium]